MNSTMLISEFPGKVLAAFHLFSFISYSDYVAGFPYIVRYQGSWHRALVEDVLKREQIVVFLVDSGFRIIITAADVRHIQEK
jgi:hypothetical protein